jgi:hypothetical protein
LRIESEIRQQVQSPTSIDSLFTDGGGAGSARRILPHVGWKFGIRIVEVPQRLHDLPQVVPARRSASGIPRVRDCRQHQGQEQADDGHHNQQFGPSKSPPARMLSRMLRMRPHCVTASQKIQP